MKEYKISEADSSYLGCCYCGEEMDEGGACCKEIHSMTYYVFSDGTVLNEEEVGGE